jgi:hypothetical protein
MTVVDANEAQLIELLAMFARTVGPGAMAAHLTTNIPPVLDAVGKSADAPAPSAAPEAPSA